jgi:predicted nucleic acid-binding protein
MWSQECRAFLYALEMGHISAHLEPLVLHELSYALRQYMKQLTKDDIAAYLLMILSWPGVNGDKVAMVGAVELWRSTAGLAFVDAYLATVATARRCPVYTKNAGELARLGVIVPTPLPGT